MKCDQCGTEDSGAPSYKPACLIERDSLKESLRHSREIMDVWSELIDRQELRIAALEAALRGCAVFGSKSLTLVDRPDLKIWAPCWCFDSEDAVTNGKHSAHCLAARAALVEAHAVECWNCREPFVLSDTPTCDECADKWLEQAQEHMKCQPAPVEAHGDGHGPCSHPMILRKESLGLTVCGACWMERRDDGRGWVREPPPERCKRCGGTATVGIPGYWGSQPCPACGGRGTNG